VINRYIFKNSYWTQLNTKIHGKNDFAEISKNSAIYRSENNFVASSK